MKSILIDFGYKTKSGMHEHLELASRRNLVAPAFIIHNVLLLDILIYLYKRNFDLISIFFSRKWTKKISNLDYVVIVASKYTLPVIAWINKKYPELCIHVYYFNIIEKDISINLFNELNCQIWTFDSSDSKKYNIGLVTNVSCYENYEKLNQNKYKKYDAIFIGFDKGRGESLIKLKKTLEKNNFKALIYLVKSKNHRSLDDSYYNKRLSYSKNVEKMSQSKSVIDFYQKGQRGTTLRPIDAGFLKIKIITDLNSIKNEPFYDQQNIYILGENRDINVFFNTEYNENFNYMYYDIEKWLERFAI